MHLQDTLHGRSADDVHRLAFEHVGGLPTDAAPSTSMPTSTASQGVATHHGAVFSSAVSQGMHAGAHAGQGSLQLHAAVTRKSRSARRRPASSNDGHHRLAHVGPLQDHRFMSMEDVRRALGCMPVLSGIYRHRSPCACPLELSTIDC